MTMTATAIRNNASCRPHCFSVQSPTAANPRIPGTTNPIGSASSAAMMARNDNLPNHFGRPHRTAAAVTNAADHKRLYTSADRKSDNRCGIELALAIMPMPKSSATTRTAARSLRTEVLGRTKRKVFKWSLSGDGLGCPTRWYPQRTLSAKSTQIYRERSGGIGAQHEEFGNPSQM